MTKKVKFRAICPSWITLTEYEVELHEQIAFLVKGHFKEAYDNNLPPFMGDLGKFLAQMAVSVSRIKVFKHFECSDPRLLSFTEDAFVKLMYGKPNITISLPKSLRHG